MGLLQAGRPAVCLVGWRLGELGEAEVENLDLAVFGDEEVLGLEVAVDDAFFVGGGQAVGDLGSDLKDLADGHRAAVHGFAQRAADEQLGDEIGRAGISSEAVDGEDVGVVKAAGGLRLLLKTPQTVRVARDVWRQNLDRDFAIEGGLAGAVDLTHASGAKWAEDFIASKFCAHGQRHDEPDYKR